jgi:hypothetical protein
VTAALPLRPSTITRFVLTTQAAIRPIQTRRVLQRHQRQPQPRRQALHLHRLQLLLRHQRQRQLQRQLQPRHQLRHQPRRRLRPRHQHQFLRHRQTLTLPQGHLLRSTSPGLSIRLTKQGSRSSALAMAPHLRKLRLWAQTSVRTLIAGSPLQAHISIGSVRTTLPATLPIPTRRVWRWCRLLLQQI